MLVMKMNIVPLCGGFLKEQNNPSELTCAGKAHSTVQERMLELFNKFLMSHFC